MQNIQEGLSGNVPMDEKWVRATVQVLKANPDIFKTLLKGKGAMFGTYCTVLSSEIDCILLIIIIIITV